MKELFGKLLVDGKEEDIRVELKAGKLLLHFAEDVEVNNWHQSVSVLKDGGFNDVRLTDIAYKNAEEGKKTSVFVQEYIGGKEMEYYIRAEKVNYTLHRYLATYNGERIVLILNESVHREVINRLSFAHYASGKLGIVCHVRYGWDKEKDRSKKRFVESYLEYEYI